MTRERQIIPFGTKCCEPVSNERGWRLNTCSRNAKVEVAGRFYCTQHDPALVKERQEKRDEERKRQWEAQDAAFARRRQTEAATQQALDALRQIAAGCNDARELAMQALALFPKDEAAP
jgi:hypothetical protein